MNRQIYPEFFLFLNCLNYIPSFLLCWICHLLLKLWELSLLYLVLLFATTDSSPTRVLCVNDLAPWLTLSLSFFHAFSFAIFASISDTRPSSTILLLLGSIFLARSFSYSLRLQSWISSSDLSKDDFNPCEGDSEKSTYHRRGRVLGRQ